MFDINCPPRIQTAAPKRKAEFLAGRYAAQQALAMMEANHHQIKIGKHRCPIWPSNILGSITHNIHTALCAVGDTNIISAIGIDTEKHIKDKTVSKIKHMIINQEEESLLKKLPIPFTLAFSLVFSAKESLFKALYPDVGMYFDFNSAKLHQLCIKRKQLIFSLQKNLSPTFQCGMLITSHYQLTEHDVFTAIVLPAKATNQ